MGEVIFAILMFFGLLGPAIYIWVRTGHWHLFAVFMTFFACFGLWEWHAVATTDMSVSQQVWAFGEAEPVPFWISIGCFIVAWLSLMYHFAVKKLSKK